jgi:TonB family protein
MKDNKKEKKFIDLPEYPGGKAAFQEFIKKNLRYPKEALENGIEGAIYVKYRVDGLGKVVHAEVTHSLGYGCDEEALRVVRLLKYGKAKNRGVRVTATMRTRINFKLPKPPTIQYNYIAKKKNEEKTSMQKKSPAGETYGYTINL